MSKNQVEQSSTRLTTVTGTNQDPHYFKVSFWLSAESHPSKKHFHFEVLQPWSRSMTICTQVIILTLVKYLHKVQVNNCWCVLNCSINMGTSLFILSSLIKVLQQFHHKKQMSDSLIENEEAVNQNQKIQTKVESLSTAYLSKEIKSPQIGWRKFDVRTANRHRIVN